MGKILKINGIVGKSFLSIGLVYFTKTNMCQIFCRSDVLKKIVGYSTSTKDIQVYIDEKYQYLDRCVGLFVKSIR